MPPQSKAMHISKMLLYLTNSESLNQEKQQLKVEILHEIKEFEKNFVILCGFLDSLSYIFSFLKNIILTNNLELKSQFLYLLNLYFQIEILKSGFVMLPGHIWSSLLLQVLGAWYEVHWWTPAHRNESHIHYNFAMTLSTKEGREGLLIFRGYRRL